MKRDYWKIFRKFSKAIDITKELLICVRLRLIKKLIGYLKFMRRIQVCCSVRFEGRTIIMKTKNENFRSVIDAGFRASNFINELGITLKDCGPGWCETDLIVKDKHLQQNGLVHAGVQSTVADHTAGGAATTIVAENEYILTLEYKLNLLRAAAGSALFCRAEVIKPGNSFSVVESSVYSVNGNEKTLVAKGTFTMAVQKK